jgi:hypothetical protein
LTKFSGHIIGCLLAAVMCASPARAALLQGFLLSQFVFSPDGDGEEESTNVIFNLTVPSPLLSIIVFESDSATVVDTLYAPASAPAGRDTVTWSGYRFDGSPAPDARYVVTFDAQGTAEQPDTTISRPTVIDRGAPSIEILGIEPSPYAPGAPGSPSVLSVSVRIAGATPKYTGVPTDTVTPQLTDPSGAPLIPASAYFTPTFHGDDGDYMFRWDGTAQSALRDGTHVIAFTVSDHAAHHASASQGFDVDVDVPRVSFTNVETQEARLAVVPDSLEGWAWDRRGIDSLLVNYASGSPFRTVESIRMSGDTLLFAVPLADSLTEEKSYRITTRAVDGVGRYSQTTLDITVDRTGPAAPTLLPFPGVAYSPTAVLRVDTLADDVEFIRIFRGGVKVDSAMTLINKAPQRELMLLPGRNVFTATALDGARNESPLSNAVEVIFDNQAGLLLPVPFGPGDQFAVNLGRPASRVVVRVYDFSGGLVVTLQQDSPGRNAALTWDGRNGGGEEVKRGPLVANAEVRYEDGETEVLREVFLFDPDR